MPVSDSRQFASLQTALAGRYVVGEEIGRGAMATVYMAEDVRHHRRVAVKLLRLETTALSAQRFLREIEIAAGLTHPHIVPLYDSGAAEDTLYYVMPYVEGESLRARLDHDGPLPVDEAVRIASEVADALSYAHGHGVVHRDVKPENILLSGGHAVVADFGIARAVTLAADESLTNTGVTLGTPAYMSPEQATGERELDGRTDLYSLGCVLYEMLAGEVPFTGSSHRAILTRKLMERPLPVSALRENVPSCVDEALTRALARAPTDRFTTVVQFGEQLTRPEEPPSRRRLRGYIAVGATALGLTLAGWGTWYLAQPEPDLDPHKVVVYPLATRAGDAPDGEGVDLLIGMALDHTEPLRWSPGWNWLSPEQRLRTGTLSNREYRNISRDLRARYYITGQILKRPDSITVVLLLHDAQGDSTVRQSSASGALGVASYGEIGLNAVRSLIPALVDPGRRVDLSLITDRAPAAIANWLRGERSYRFSRFADALAFYRRALEDDSLMAFAALKGVQAANWSHQPDQASELLQRALLARHALPERYQSFLDGLDAYIRGSPDTALALLSSALAANPGWSEASMLMGEVHMHLLPRRVSIDSAVHHFREAALDPGFTPPLIHLAEQALREGRVDDADRLRRQLAENGANAEALNWLETMSRCVRDGPEAIEFVALARSNLNLVYDVSMLLAPGASQSRCARAGLEALLTTDSWTTEYSWEAAQALQGLLIAEGNVEHAAAFLSSLHETGQQASNPLLRNASLAAVFLAVLNTAAGAEMRALVERVEVMAEARYGPGYEGVSDVSAAWLLGILHAQKGDVPTTTFLRDYLARVAARHDDPRDAANAAVREAALSARLLVLSGDTAAAIEGFEALSSVARPSTLRQSLSASLAPERIELARLYLARQQYKAALDVAAAFDHPMPTVFLPFIVPSLEIRLEAARALRDAQRAEQYTRRLRALGRDARGVSAG